MLNNFFARLTVAFMDIKEGEEGQGMVEYALILALISVVAIAIIGTLGGQVKDAFTSVSSQF